MKMNKIIMKMMLVVFLLVKTQQCGAMFLLVKTQQCGATFLSVLRASNWIERSIVLSLNAVFWGDIMNRMYYLKFDPQSEKGIQENLILEINKKLREVNGILKSGNTKIIIEELMQKLKDEEELLKNLRNENRRYFNIFYIRGTPLADHKQEIKDSINRIDNIIAEIKSFQPK